MSKLRNRLIVVFTVMMVAVAWGGGLLLNDRLTPYNATGYPIIPIFFLLTGIGFIYSITSKPKTNDAKKMVNKYMLIRVVKVLLSLSLLLTYWLVNRDELKNFAIIFVIYYMLYLLFETFTYLQVEKTIKLENQKKDVV